MRASSLALMTFGVLACHGPLERWSSSLESAPAAASPADGGSPVVMEFEPPGRKTLTERSTWTRTESRDEGVDAKGRSVQTVEATLLSRYDPIHSGGWMLTQWISAVVVTREGRASDDPWVRVVKGFPLKLKLAGDGVFVQLLNPQDGEAAARQASSALGQPEVVSQLFSAPALEERARREWEAKYGALFHRQLLPGSARYAFDVFGTSEGRQIPYLIERTFSGTTRTDFGEGLVFSIRCISQIDKQRDPQMIRNAFPEEDLSRLDSSVACTGQDLLARKPFVPVKSWISVTASPDSADGRRPLRVTFAKQVVALKLE
ncbi:MAG TPA: hypothetical protein VF947_06660 [Myxococcales bacterium]